MTQNFCFCCIYPESKKMIMKKVWFITGSSRGLGRSLTAAVLEKGDCVAATARRPEDLKDFSEKFPDLVEIIPLDVTQMEEIEAAVRQTIKRFGRVDVLVNNAGFGITGAAEAYSDAQVRSQLETNLYGPIAITRAILPIMRKQRSGHILQISSIGGRVASAGLSIYQTAKFGLGGFSEALHKEVSHLGIHVTCIEPGGFRTDWGGSSMSYAPKVEGYASTVDTMAAFLSAGGYVPMGDPVRAAKVMIDLIDHPNPPVHLILGSEAVSILKQANQLRNTEFEKWISVSQSTDAEGAVNLFETEEGRSLARLKMLE
jgi:NAD(P)-dependent dehydrogenase (short-subunit alcohol dehydrogenase family)